MTLVELQKVMGDRIKATLRDDLSPEERQTENEQTALIIETAKQMINNADVILRAQKLVYDKKMPRTSAIALMIEDANDGEM